MSSRRRNARIDVFGVQRFCDDELDMKTIERAAAVISFISDVLASITSLICVLEIVGESTVGVGTWANMDGSTSGDESISPCEVNQSSI